MINLRDIIEFCKAEAIAGKFYPTESTDWRWFCREYSKTFHTPLHEVLALPPELVILSIFEEQVEARNLEKEEDLQALTEQVRRLEDPNYDDNQEKDLDQFVADVEAWDENRVREGKSIPVPKKSVFREPKPETPKEPELPKQGFIDLSYLEKEDQES